MPTPGWSYAVRVGTNITIIGDISPKIVPYASPPIGIDMPPMDLNEQPTWPVGSLVTSSMHRSRTLAFTVGVVANSLTELSGLRRVLYNVMRSSGEKWLYISPQYVPLSQVTSQMFGARYHLVGVETTMTGPTACDVTFRCLMEMPYFERFMQQVTIDAGTLYPSGVFIYDVAGSTDFTTDSTFTDYVGVVAHNNQFFCFRSGQVRRYNTNGTLAGAESVPFSGVIIIENHAGGVTAVGQTQLARWTGSSWVVWGPTVSGGTIFFAQRDVTGGLLWVCGNFTSPRRAVFAVDGNGNIVTSEYLPPGSYTVRSAYSVEDMLMLVLEGGSFQPGIYVRPLGGTANLEMIARLDDSPVARIAPSPSWSSVYVCTQASSVNGSPSGKLLRIDGGTWIRTVGEGIIGEPRLIRRIGDEYYVTHRPIVGNTGVVRIRANGGLAWFCRTFSTATDIAAIGSRFCIVGNFSHVYPIRRYNIAQNADGIALRAATSGISQFLPLAVWTDYYRACWTVAVNAGTQGEMDTISKYSTLHSSGTDWELERFPVGTGSTLYVMPNLTAAYPASILGLFQML